MPFRITEIHIPISEDESGLAEKVASILGIQVKGIKRLVIIRKSLDARKKQRIVYSYNVEVEVTDEAEVAAGISDPRIKLVKKETPHPPSPLNIDFSPVIVGTGPAGLFAALRLAERGIKSIILERGREVEKRVRDVERFWSERVLDPESNVQFGEGGAGTFSDGKLTTRVDDPRISYILRKLVEAGAREEIVYLAKPHIGTDRLRVIVKNLRNRLMELGCEVRFQSKVTGFRIGGGKMESLVINDSTEMKVASVILAIGNSARDTYEALRESGIMLEVKPFAIGLRVEHPQKMIDRCQYGEAAGHPNLPPAEYLLTHNMPLKGRSVYSFCMCPGGSVIAASSEPGRLVINGMSLSGRDSPFANSAIVVTVRPDDFGSHPLAGMEFQRRWEEAAFMAGGGNYNAPAQNLAEFMDPSRDRELRGSSYKPALTRARLDQCLPPFVAGAVRDALPFFDRKMKGFLSSHANLIGVETRTSASVRITRGKDFQSVNTKGLYPCGEGAGYAGGIVSSALDGIRAADAVISEYDSNINP